MAAQCALRNGDPEGARRRLVALALDATAGDVSERALESLSDGWPDPPSRYRAPERARVADTAVPWLDSGRPQAALDLLLSTERSGATPDQFSPDEALAAADALNRLGRSAEALLHGARAAQRRYRLRRSGIISKPGSLHLGAVTASIAPRSQHSRKSRAGRDGA